VKSCGVRIFLEYFILETTRMRTLTLHLPDAALPTLDIFLKKTTAARVFRRAQAVRDVVHGRRLQTVSETLHCTSSALRKWGYRVADQGVHGLVERPRSGRPPKVTCELAQHLNRLIDHAPLEHGSRSSQGSCRELATVFARDTGVHLGRESVRGVLQKQREAPIALPVASIPPPLTSRMVRVNGPPSSPRRAVARSVCSMKTKPSCGALPCSARAGGAPPSARASLHAR